jgi:group I intron endonuclease
MKKEIISGIYLWTNIVNDKKYVGCSVNIYKRWGSHIVNAKLGSGTKFYNAIRKYGVENFKKEIIEVLPSDKKTLKDREDYYIDFYDSIKSGYNIEKQYNGLTFHPNYNQIVKQISNKAKLRKWINNGEKNITICPENLQDFLHNGWKLGRLKFSKEHIDQLSKSHVGYKLTPEQKKSWCSGKATKERIWVHSDEKRKMIKKENLNYYLDNGWELGIGKIIKK